MEGPLLQQLSNFEAFDEVLEQASSALYKCFNDFKQQMTQEGFGVRHLCAVCFKRSFHYWTANRPYKSRGLLLFPLRPVSVAIAAGRQLSRQHLKKIKC